MMVDLEHHKLKREMEYEEKLQKIDKKLQKDWKEKRNVNKAKHDMKLDQARAKQEQLMRDDEEHSR